MLSIPSVPHICIKTQSRNGKVAPFGRSLSVSMGTQSALSTAYVIRWNGVMRKSTSLTTNMSTTFISKFHFSSVHFDAEKQRGALLSEQPL
jgi:hypothetical protein